MILELISTALTAAGLGLLLVALGIRLVHGSWTRTQGITFEYEGHPYLRWHDHRYRIVEALWSSGARRRRRSPSPPLPAGEEVTMFYHARHPTQWSLDEPHRGLRALAVVGLVAAVVGTLLGFLPV